LAAVAYAKRGSDDKVPPLKYRASVVDTGSITHTVTATGTINPVALVNVGSQVSGTVVELKADFNDRVKKGNAAKSTSTTCRWPLRTGGKGSPPR
jgi:HlyD family secretion protein